MIVFGLILVLLAVAAGVVLFLATQSLATPVNLEFAGYNWGMTPLALLVTGAVVMLVLWLGLGLIRGSVKRRRRPAREAKEAERQAKIEESIRADERARAEETHQSALAERDRVREEEFQARLAERDRERDDEFANREHELIARHQATQEETHQRVLETEERVRTEERARVEQEYASRPAAAGAAGAGSAMGAGTASGSTTGTEFQTGEATDESAVGSTIGHEATDSDTGTGRHSADRETVGADEAAVSADGTDEERESSHHGFRTVADKIMGRDPDDRG